MLCIFVDNEAISLFASLLRYDLLNYLAI